MRGKLQEQQSDSVMQMASHRALIRGSSPLQQRSNERAQRERGSSELLGRWGEVESSSR